MSPSLPSQTKENWHVTVIGAGSVEHFHHFLLGLFVPLIYQLSTKWAKAQFNRLIIRSCGPLDSLIHEFRDDRIEIVDRDRHRQMAEAAAHSGFASADTLAMQDAKIRFVTIRGCDYPFTYDRGKFAKAREVLLSIGTIRSEMRSLADNWPRSGARILLIQRGPSPVFYYSDRAETKGSGQERRSIANHEELYRSLDLDYVGCLNVMTEKLTLARQFALFSLADIIIAQHGAALANIVWARPSATVIEIFPNTLTARQMEHDFFFNLSRCMGLRYRRVRQDHEHSDVDIDEIREIVAKSIASPAYRVVPRLRSAAFRISRPAMRIRRGLSSFIHRVWSKASQLGRRPLRSSRSKCVRILPKKGMIARAT